MAFHDLFSFPVAPDCNRCGLRDAAPDQRRCTACLDLEHQRAVDRYRFRLAFEAREQAYLDELARREDQR